jgi:hypothetical protein
MASCDRLTIGLSELLLHRKQADSQSAAGCHPAPLWPMQMTVLSICF